MRDGAIRTSEDLLYTGNKDTKHSSMKYLYSCFHTINTLKVSLLSMYPFTIKKMKANFFFGDLELGEKGG